MIMSNPKQHSFPGPQFVTSNKLSTKKIKSEDGFAKIIAGGRIVRPDPHKPEIERMVIGDKFNYKNNSVPSSHERAVLESVSINLEAGIAMVDKQETALAKIGGKLSEIALALNQVKSPRSCEKARTSSQVKFEESRDRIREIAQETFDHVALFSNGPSKPVTIAVPSSNAWEGINIDRSNLNQPGLQVVDKGKVYGNSPGFFLDSGSITKAFNEWRSLCIHNRLQWGLLFERLHGITRSLKNFGKGKTWRVPPFSSQPKLGPLRRPNRNN